MTERNPSRPCGHIHPDTGWPNIAYCTLEAGHEGPHHSALKNITWEDQWPPPGDLADIRKAAAAARTHQEKK